MPTTFRLGILAILGGVLAFVSAPAIAQAPKPGGNQVAQENFNRFLNNHPNVASELAKNPNLVNDEKFLATHPGLQKFLETHPGVQKQVASSPGAVTNSGGHYEWNRGAGAAAIHGTGNYLLEHPEVAQQLQANPSLLESKEYVDAHPGLRQFMNQHPNLRGEMKVHPYGFVSQRGRGYLPPPVPPAQ